jgi:hypothetical protein
MGFRTRIKKDIKTASIIEGNLRNGKTYTENLMATAMAIFQ